MVAYFIEENLTAVFERHEGRKLRANPVRHVLENAITEFLSVT